MHSINPAPAHLRSDLSIVSPSEICDFGHIWLRLAEHPLKTCCGLCRFPESAKAAKFLSGINIISIEEFHEQTQPEGSPSEKGLKKVSPKRHLALG
jgi:hypothetical protein